MPAAVLVLEKTWEKGEEKREASQNVLRGTLGDGSRAAGCGAGTAGVGWQPQLREPTRVCGLMPGEVRAQSCTACVGGKGQIWPVSSSRSQKARAGGKEQGGGRKGGRGLACCQGQKEQKAKECPLHGNRKDPGFAPLTTPSCCCVGFAREGMWQGMAE